MRYTLCMSQSYIAGKDELRIRPMRDELGDYTMIAKWRSQPAILEWFDNDGLPVTVETMIQKYRPRIAGEQKVFPCIIEHQGQPVGLIQYYETHLQGPWEYDEPLLIQQGTWGIDLFVGEIDQWGKGIGSSALGLIAEYVRNTCNPAAIVIDPDVRNERAIRSYEKAGFRKLRIMKPKPSAHGKSESWLMTFESEPSA
jgi:aminoglycoside 6'-N-acetyltransferase